MEIERIAMQIRFVRANEVLFIYESFFPQRNQSASKKCARISAPSQFQTSLECFPGIESGS